YKDLDHGVFELWTKEAIPRHIVVDDPGETVVVSIRGGSYSVDHVTNSPSVMADLQSAQQDALRTFTLGALQGPTTTGPGGTGSTPCGSQNFAQPFNFTLPTGDLTPASNQSNGTTNRLDIIPPTFTPPTSPPPPSPTITIAAISAVSPGVGIATNNIINA